jgi:hypothetical protein
MKARTALGIVLAIASLPLFVGGGFVIKSAIDANGRAEKQIEATNKKCMERLRSMGEVKELSSGIFEVTIKQVKDPRKALTDATVAQSMCPYRSMTNFCLGDTCDKASKGVSMKFTLRNRKD